MANSYQFSNFFRARVLRAIAGEMYPSFSDSTVKEGVRKLHAITTQTQTTHSGSVLTQADIDRTSPSSTQLRSVANGNISFLDGYIKNSGTAVGVPGLIASEDTEKVYITNAEPSATLTIPAGHTVQFIAITDSANKLLAYVKLTNASTHYYYEEQGTLTVPANGYTFMFPKA